jgi:hypothetical protein
MMLLFYSIERLLDFTPLGENAIIKWKEARKELGFRDIPREQFIPVLRRRSKRRPLKKSRQIFKRFKTVLFGRLNKRVNAARAFSSVRGLWQNNQFFPLGEAVISVSLWVLTLHYQLTY